MSNPYIQLFIYLYYSRNRIPLFWEMEKLGFQGPNFLFPLKNSRSPRELNPRME
jgi:hypothetical protein